MKHLHKKPTQFTFNLPAILAIAFIIVLMTITSSANEPACEVWNYDTQKCETFAMQDISVNTEWAEFVASTKEWTDEEVQAYLNK